MAIDMKSYAGEIEPPAAVEQQGPNQFQRESQDEAYPVPPPVESEAQVENEIQHQAEPKAEAVQELNFKALSESVERLKAEKEAEKREYQLQLDMLRANVARNHQPEEPKPKKMFEGMGDNDIPNVGELRKAWEERELGYNQKIEELQVANLHPDYADVLGKYGKHLAETDPAFLQGIKAADNKALFAYQYAKKEQEIQQLREQVKANSQITPKPQSVTAQKIVENARKPGTLAQAGGQTALSQVDYYKGMSDQEFMKLASKHLEAI